MKRLLFLILIFFISIQVIGQNSSVFKLPKGVTENDYRQNTVIFKVKDLYREQCEDDGISNPLLNLIFSDINVETVYKMFPNHQPLVEKFNEYGQELVDISLIYQMKYNANRSIEKVVNDLNSTGIFEYVNVRYNNKPLYIPNDPDLHKQFYLRTTKAYEAWDVCQGDTNVVIAITDTGIDLVHPDLRDNLKYNYYDPIDGIDNDNDGFTDNFYGWDLGSGDNNPQVDKTGHGVHVTGIAAASVNNGIGIAGTGNKCKFVPVKVEDSDGNFLMDWESIVYSADFGVDVINCSWGGRFYPGQFGNDIVNYATYNRNSLVVAACGNSGDQSIYIPAALPNVFSVAAVDSMDVKWVNSTYNHTVDISAPGTVIYSTWIGGYYLSSHGTSMACPIVSAGAALVKSKFPNLNALQLAEKLRISADNIDAIPANSAFSGYLGSGRINLYKALTDTVSPSVRIISDSLLLTNPGNTTRDTFEVYLDFMNYLEPVQNLTVTMTSNSSYVQVIPLQLNINSIGTMSTANNYSKPFKVVVFPNAPGNHKVIFKVNYSAPGYQAFEYIDHIFDKEYINVKTQYLETTVTGNSLIGFNDHRGMEGKGFLYKQHRNSLYGGGLVLGVSSSRVSDNLAGDVYYNTDFSLVDAPQKSTSLTINPSKFIQSKFSDSLANQNLDVRVTQNFYAFDTAQDAKYVIYEYLIKNAGSVALNNFYAGIYMDWDIGYSAFNRANFEGNYNAGYAYNTSAGVHCGVQVLTKDPVYCYSFDNDGINNSIDIYDGFSSFEKYTALTNNRYKAGWNTSSGNDISQMVSTGPITINPGDTALVAFAVIIADHLLDLRHSAQAAIDKYYNVVTIPEVQPDYKLIKRIFPNPTSSHIYIEFGKPLNDDVQISLLDISGRLIKQWSQSELNLSQKIITINTKHFESGLYFLSIECNGEKELLKVVVE